MKLECWIVGVWLLLLPLLSFRLYVLYHRIVNKDLEDKDWDIP